MKKEFHEGMMKKEDIANVVSKTSRLAIEILTGLRSQGVAEKDLWMLVNGVPESHNLAVEQRQLNSLYKYLNDANPHMLSRQIINEKVLYGVVGFALEVNLSDDEVAQRVQDIVVKLVTFEAERDVDVPIVNIAVGSEPFSFGPVTFHSITEQDRELAWWRDIEAYWGNLSAYNDIVSYARVVSSGDLTTCISYAGTTVDEILLLLRGAAFPITTENINQIGVINDFAALQYRPYRTSNPKQNHPLEFSSPSVLTLGPGKRPYNLQGELFSEVSPADLSALVKLIKSKGLNPQDNISAKVLGGFRWIGEATKPDSISARFAKLALALETLIGGDPRDQMLTSSGITALLAERAAFLISGDDGKRLSTDSQVRNYYKIRSRIVHGGKAGEITEEQFAGFGKLVRDIAWSLLCKVDQLSTIDELAKWVMKQRYS